MEHTPICYIAGALPLPKNFTLSLGEGDFVIAADGGHLHLAQCGIVPHVVVGDFDSSTAPSDHPNVVTLPVEKDDTDVGYAIRMGQERGFTRFVLLGCFGGLFDHSMANIQHLHALAVSGSDALLVGDNQCATVVTDEALTLNEPSGGRCSVFALGGEAQGVTLSGLYYTVTNHTLSPTVPLGVSNSFTTNPATISVERGSLLVVWDYKNPISNFF